MIRRALFFLVLCAGCGARSGLEVDRADAAIDAQRPDAQVFDTLRCRWMASRSIGLADARGALDVRGVAGRDADVVIASAIPARSADLRAFEIVPADPSTLRATHVLADEGEDRPALLAWRGGFVEARGAGGSCALRWLDHSLRELDVQVLDADRSCSVDALSRTGVAVITEGLAGSTVRIIGRDGATPEDRVLGALPTRPLATPHAARTSDGVTVVHRDADASGLAVTIFADGGVLSGDPISGRIAIGSAVGEPLVATDPVRGGAVVLSRTIETGWRIDHVELDGDRIVSFLLSDESVWTATPDPEHVGFVTNESEALVTAGCATVVVPLAISEPWTIPGPDDCAGVLRTILRTDTSFGGQLYLGRGDELRFRALVCNR